MKWQLPMVMNQPAAPDMTGRIIEKIITAMRDCNYMIMNGTFRQFQVAYGKYEILKELLVEDGHQIVVANKVTYTESNSPRTIFTSISIDGNQHTIPLT